MKILISTKNSKWKVVQNPLKGNFYTDVINFKSDQDKDLFLQQNVNSDWKNLDNYIEINPTWTDEIHFNFKVDLSKVKIPRDVARRCDFAIVYLENKYWFYTLESSLSTPQVYTTLQFNAELDVFFTYGINNIWKNNAQVEVQRGIINNQSNFDFETTLLNTPEEHQPVLTLKNNGKDLFGGQNTGYLVFIQPKSRFAKGKVRWIDSNGNKDNNWNIAGGQGISLVDTILLNARKASQGVQTDLLMFNVNDPIYSKVWGPLQLSDTNTSYLYQNKYCVIYVPSNTNKVFFKPYRYSDLMSSPDVLRIVPINYTPKTTPIILGLFWNGFNIVNSNLTYAENSQGNGNFNVSTNYTLDIVNEGTISNTDSFNVSHFIQTEAEENELYNPSQYSKLFTRPYLNYQLTTQDGNSMVIDQVGLGNVSTVSFTRKRSISLESNASKLIINQGMYFDDLRSPYTLQINDNLIYFQSSSEWLNYAQNNQQSINQQSKQLRKSSLWDKIRGGLSIASGALSAGVGLATGGVGSVLGLGGLSNSITSGIQQIQQSNNGINSLNASIEDAQSGKEQILDTGSEYQRLVDLDDPFSVRIRELSLTQKQKESIGYFFHKYGYSLPNLIDNPINWLNNGKYWSYNQFTFDSTYQAFNETLSPQESKIAALSLSQGVRVWHWDANVPNDWEVGNYKYRNV